ncbi:MAG: SDR family NAD(P)-dependent oxidoreductase [Bacteroidales bacterium]|nr:SDR family NAD(P)-dependent oxidoreductase [Bacteroidales bacterium]
MNIIVTGATGSIGNAAVQMLRKEGHTVIGTSRRAEHDGFRPLDISSPASIEAFVRSLASDNIRIDGLLNNAGTMQRHYRTTPEGHELVTATNYLGTYLLTRSLLPLMNPGAHIVFTISLSCHIAHLDDHFLTPDPVHYSQLLTYANSKMAVMLFAEELHRRMGQYFVIHLTDPGIVNSRMIHLDRWFDPLTDLIFRPFTLTPQQGAVPAVNALLHTSPAVPQTDTLQQPAPLLLFHSHGHSLLPHHWQNPQQAQWLWEETEKLLFK